MPDFRQSREREWLEQPVLNYHNDPSYIPQDQLGGSGMGGAGNESGLSPAHIELLDRLEGGLNRSEQLGQESRGLMDALQANYEAQRSQGNGLDVGGMWQGMKDAGSQGMDLFSSGLNAVTPSQDSINNLAMRFQNAHAIGTGQMPLYMRQQQQQMEMVNHQDLMSSRRQQLAQQLEGIKEQRRGHDLQLLEKALASPRAAALLEQLGQDPNYSMAQHAAMLHKGLKDSDYGSFQAYMDFIPEDVQKRFMDGKLPQHELTAWLDEARTEAKESAKVNAKNAIITRAMNKQSEERTPYEQQLVEEHQAKLEVEQMKPKKAQAEIKEKESQARMQDAHAKLYDSQREHPDLQHPDRTEINRVSLAITGKSFDQLPPGSPMQRRVIEEHASRYSQARQNTVFDAPIPQKERAKLYTTKGLEKLDLERAPEGITEREARTGQYTELTAKDEEAITEFRVAKTTANTLFKTARELIKADGPVSALQQKLRLEAGAASGLDGVAAGYKANLEAFSSRMARLVEVGVLTQGDVDRWKSTFPTFGNTTQTIDGKQALFSEIQNEAERLLKMKLTGKPVEKHRSKLDQLLGRTEKFKEADGGQEPSLHKPTSKEEYDKIPSGAKYLHPSGKWKVKP